jgi:hypothetical protein
VPYRVVGPALVDDLDRLELEALRVGIDGIDDAAASRRQRADIQVVGGRHGEADEPLVLEHRHAEGDIRAVRCPAIGIIVHDDVARTNDVAARRKAPQYAPHISRDRA